MFLNFKDSEQYANHSKKTLLKLSKIVSDFKNQELSSLEEKEEPPSTLLFKELSKPVLDDKKLNRIKTKGTFPKIRRPDEERNIQLIIEKMKRYRGYEQFITLHKICDKSLMIMAAVGNIERFNKGETIYAKKDHADKFYYIIKGSVSVIDFDPKKFTVEYGNKIDDYKNKNNNIKNSNLILDYYSNIKPKENDKSTSLFNSISSVSYASSNYDNSNSSSIFNDKGKDLLQTKMERIEKIKTRVIRTNSNKKALLDEVIISKKRKPFFFKDNYINNDKRESAKEEKNNNNENKNKYIESFNRLQIILNKHKEKCTIINEFREGNFFGEWELIYKKNRQYTAYTLEDTDLLVLDSSFFKDYFKSEMMIMDFERKFFIRKTIPILNINYLPIMIPIFYSKGDIVYTEFDTAKYFYIIYKGLGALKQLKAAKDKKDIMLHIKKLETLMIIDKGCIVGLECTKNFNNQNEENVYYDNTFIITEQNTLVYRINLNKFKINKEDQINLKNWLKELYQKQYKLIKDYREKLNKPKITREMLLKNFDKKYKKFYFCRDLMKTTINNNNKKNEFPFKKKLINLSTTFRKRKPNFFSDNKYNISTLFSNYKSYSNRSSLSNANSISCNSQSKSKSNTKSTKLTSISYNNKTIIPFLLKDEFYTNNKSLNPINQRNCNANELGSLYDKKKMSTFSSGENKDDDINAFNYKMSKLWNSKSKPKNSKNRNTKNESVQTLQKLRYDDSFYKLIFKNHFRKVAVSSKKKNAKKKINLFLYDSGQFNIPLLGLSTKKTKLKKNLIKSH